MQQHLLVAAATVELSPAFQSRESSHIVVLVAAATVDTELQNQPSLPRLGTDALMVPALKSRAKLTRSLPRPGKRWLHYFFKDHKFVGHFGIRQQYLAHRKLTSFLYSGGFTLNDLYCSASSENVIFSASIVFSPLVSRSLSSLRRSFSA